MGSHPEELGFSISSPLPPKEQTSGGHAGSAAWGQERPIEVAGEVGTILIPAAVTLQGVCTLHAAMTVSFDRPSYLWEPWY
jgi:hypothetical protein